MQHHQNVALDNVYGCQCSLLDMKWITGIKLITCAWMLVALIHLMVTCDQQYNEEYVVSQ